MKKEIQIPTTSTHGAIRTERRLTEDGHVEQMLNMNDAEYEITNARHKEAEALVERTGELVKKAQEAYDTVDYLLTHITNPIEEYTAFIKEALTRLRDQKMAMQTETRAFMSSLREVREFFLEDRHEEEVRRLVEFIDLCERLQALKESGFLDTVADTILRLSDR